ncbi:hypothetical protein LTR91_005528 [Friedmanniomyces endolithicus]|uniref:Uncharacterized protein n=1 Tax=Friedmanniomyces endolithicus TaxID=329885 RepID=A0AAN6KSM5_9PEZI|nr:hypothetical protein LTR57_008179 [Friedmanniomyces endolithicus]KAK1000957.1 hypothetical protein LTR91_005528 [Friedmanniomyces endolithicus]KAK1014089.1 hypothetical protein LTS01_000619 [Friedmanniomyces endolithicus]KAK1045512.1 hypothetical protein LTS16_006495 [Friedmanniomyces endolithicus]
MSTPLRPQLVRTPTWPPSTLRIATKPPQASNSDSETMSTPTTSKPIPNQYLDEDLEDHPDAHFLSPLYEYEDWASGSDADDSDTEWNAGITDFALFQSDTQRANETSGPVDSKWAAFVSEQQLARQRAAQRSRVVSPDLSKPPLPFEDLPGLAPDSSPSLRDDLEPEAHGMAREPSYLTTLLSPPRPEEQTIGPGDSLPLSLDHFDDDGDYDDGEVEKGLWMPMVPTRVQSRLRRPGMKGARTLSGKRHAWRRPGWGMYSIGEEAEAEGEGKEEEAVD